MSKTERLKHVELWSVSGMSKKAYCQANGLKYTTFLTWFKIEKSEPSSGQFVMVAEDDFSGLEIRFPNGIRVQYQGTLSRELIKLLKDA